MTLADRIRDEGARLAAACTACGACVRACPMTAYVPAAMADISLTAFGMRDLLTGGVGNAPGLAWVAVCARSGVCSDACPEHLDAAFLLRLAQMRAKGALDEAPRIPVKEDTGFSARVKAFARLTLTEGEQAEWL
jgi:ferredoxin